MLRAGSRMNFNLYGTRHVWLVVPDGIRAPQAAVDRFGPLEFLGEVDGGDLEAGELARITGEIDTTSFAVVADDIAQRWIRSLADGCA
jgi:hypothetical protein